MKIMNSKYDGTCSITGQSFAAGTEIVGIARGWAISKYTTQEGIIEWAATQKAAALDILSSIPDYPAEKIQKAAARMDRELAEILANWPTLMGGRLFEDNPIRPIRQWTMAAQDTATIAANRAKRAAAAA